MKHTEPLQEELFNEIIARIKQTDISVPYKDNAYFYYTRFEEGGEYPDADIGSLEISVVGGGTVTEFKNLKASYEKV